jgi:hypothetical protein
MRRSIAGVVALGLLALVLPVPTGSATRWSGPACAAT